jgi:hypothetical protein
MGERLGAEIAGGVVGGAVFFAGWGLAKLLTAPFRHSHKAMKNELHASQERVSQTRTVTKTCFFFQATQNTQEYDQYDISNLIEADQKWKADAPRRQADAELNMVFAHAREQQIQAEGGYPWQRQAAWDAEKARKQAIRKEKGWIVALFAK